MKVNKKPMTANLFTNHMQPIQPKLFRLAKRLLVSQDAAHDAVQDVMIKLWQKRSQLVNISNIEAFAMTVTKNHCYDQLKLKHNQNLSLVHDNVKDETKTVEERIETSDNIKRLNRCMQALPDHYKLVIQLRDIESYNYEDIAEIMQMKPIHVRVTLSRARKALIKLMKSH